MNQDPGSPDRPQIPDEPPLPPGPPPPPGDLPPGATWPGGGPGGPPAGTARRGVGRVVLIGAIVLVLLAVGGGAAAFFLMRGSDEELLGLMPADRTDVALVAYLDPSAGQKVNLLRMADKFPALGDRNELTGRLRSMLDEALRPVGLDAGVLDWVGVEAAVTVDLDQPQAPDVAVLIDADDEDAAEADLATVRASTPDRAWASSEHEGIEVWSTAAGGEEEQAAIAMVHGVVVVGNGPDIVKGVIDTAEGSVPALEADEAFTTAVSELPEGKLGLLYVDVATVGATFVDAARASGVTTAGTALESVEAIRSFAMSVSAEPDGVAIDAVSSVDPSKLGADMRAQLSAPDEENELLAWVPSDAFAVAAQQHVDLAVDALVAQLAATDPAASRALEDAGFGGENGFLAHLTGDVVIGGAPDAAGKPGAAVIVGTDERDATQRALDTLAGFLSSGGGATATAVSSGEPRSVPGTTVEWREEEYNGVTITSAVGAFPVAYAAADGAAVVATSSDQIKRVIDTMQGGESVTEDPGFASAVDDVPVSDGLLYVDVQRARNALSSAVPPDQLDEFNGSVGRNLDPIAAVVIGIESDERQQRFRMFVRIP